jgi:hypothetical protein
VDAECGWLAWMRHMRLPDHSHPTLKVSEAACVWMRECGCMVWMHHSDRLTHSSSNLKVSEAACADGCGCMGMDATCDCSTILIQPEGQ